MSWGDFFEKSDIEMKLKKLIENKKYFTTKVD